jgi:probable rRNA maturation factor
MPAARVTRARLSIDVTDGLGRPLRGDRLGAWLVKAAPRAARGHVTIAIVSDTQMRTLNRRHRGRNAPTDVLSFLENDKSDKSDGSDRNGARTANAANAVDAANAGPQTPQLPSLSHSRRLGELAIARGVAARQARRFGHPVATELKILALHGLLHLLGYDHDTDQGEMAQAESRLRRRAGLPDGLIARAAPGRHRA